MEGTDNTVDGVGEFHIHIVRLPSYHPPFTSNKPEPGVGPPHCTESGPPRGGHHQPDGYDCQGPAFQPHRLYSQHGGRTPAHCHRTAALPCVPLLWTLFGNIEIRCWPCPTLLALVTGLKSGIGGVLLGPPDPFRNTYIPIIYIQTTKFYSCFQIVYTS